MKVFGNYVRTGFIAALAVLAAIFVLGISVSAYADDWHTDSGAIQHFSYRIFEEEGTILLEREDTSVLSGELPEGNYSKIIIGEGFTEVNHLEYPSFPNNITEVEIQSSEEEPLRVIGEKAFLNYHKLSKINIPASVTTIGNNAFCNCTSLETIDIKNVKTIEAQAFYYCENLEKVLMNDGKLESIGLEAFLHCIKLKDIGVQMAEGKIALPASLTAISFRAFYECEALESIYIPDNVETITEYSFSFCSNLQTISGGRGVKTIEANAFISSGLVSFPALNNLETIGERSFALCRNLKSISFNNGLKTIGDFAFGGCNSLGMNSDIVIPATVTYIGKDCFEACTELKNLSILQGDDELTIGESFLAECYNLQEVTIPANATGISPKAFFYFRAGSNVKVNTAYAVAAKLDFNTVPGNVSLIFAADDVCNHLQKYEGEYRNCKVEPTCTEKGAAFYMCRVCKKQLSETYEVPAIGHLAVIGGRYLKSEATCTAPKVYYYECANCNCSLPQTYEEGEPLPHSLSDRITSATVKTDGKIEKVCSSCGLISSTTVIPKAIVSVNESVKYTGKSLKPVKVKDSKGKTIPSKYYTITYKNNAAVGKATATISFKGNYANVNNKPVKVSFYIVPQEMIPANVSGLNVVSGSKQLKLSWKAVGSNADGYQIQYAADKSFTTGLKTVNVKKVKTAVIKKLKSQTSYYVRIRAYNKEGKLTAYSSKWTTFKKAVKTK